MPAPKIRILSNARPKYWTWKHIPELNKFSICFQPDTLYQVGQIFNLFPARHFASSWTNFQFVSARYFVSPSWTNCQFVSVRHFWKISLRPQWEFLRLMGISIFGNSPNPQITRTFSHDIYIGAFTHGQWITIHILLLPLRPPVFPVQRHPKIFIHEIIYWNIK